MPTPSGLATILAVPERGTLPISRSKFRALTESESISRLVQGGIITLFRSRDVPYGIRASCFVGHAILQDGDRLEVHEKTQGALHTLLLWSLPADLRGTRLPSKVGPKLPILDMFARQFLRSLAYYVRHGRLKAYLPSLQKSSTVRGKICIRETVRLLGRGQRGQLVQRPTTLSANVLVNRLLHLGLVAVDQLFSANERTEEVLAEARMYAPLFYDADIHEFRRCGYSFIADAFARGLKEPKTSEYLQTALAYARALVLHLGIWPTDDSSAVIPQSFFLNLETLFEEAVRQVFSEVVPSLAVQKGAALKHPLFVNLPSRYVADPDGVISKGDEVALVLDTKYKQLAKYPDHSDVYQLFAHCSALGSSTGILIYPAEDRRLGVLGMTKSQIKVHWGTVRIGHLSADLENIARELSVIEPNTPTSSSAR